MTTVTKEDICRALSALGIQHGDTVIVHSSLKSLGHVENGPDTVIDALLETLGDDGTLVMPALAMKNFAHAYEEWSMDRPSDAGLITEVFRKRPGVLRSDQETHSVTAFGKKAKALTDGHKAFGPRTGKYGDYAFSKSSPWQKMYDMNAGMLFIGVLLDKCTMKHLAEYMFVEEILEKHPEADNELRHFGQGESVCPDRFWPYANADVFLDLFRKENLVKETVCGKATLLYIPAKPFVDETLACLHSDPEHFTDPGSFRQPHQIDWAKTL